MASAASLLCYPLITRRMLRITDQPPKQQPAYINERHVFGQHGSVHVHASGGRFRTARHDAAGSYFQTYKISIMERCQSWERMRALDTVIMYTAAGTRHSSTVGTHLKRIAEMQHLES